MMYHERLALDGKLKTINARLEKLEERVNRGDIDRTVTFHSSWLESLAKGADVLRARIEKLEDHSRTYDERIETTSDVASRAEGLACDAMSKVGYLEYRIEELEDTCLTNGQEVEF